MIEHEDEQDKIIVITRRKFLFGSAITTASAALGAGYVVHGECTEDFEIVEQTITLPSLPKRFSGYRIGFISDIHLSQATTEEFVKDVFSSISQRKIDFLVLGGDLIWHPEGPAPNIMMVVRSKRFVGLDTKAFNFAVFEAVTDLALSVKAPDGIIAVFGNHDRWTHPTALQQVLSKTPIKLLRNEFIPIKRKEEELIILGVDDYLTGIPRVPELPPKEGRARILISHNPDFVNDIINHSDDRFDFAICGHTHGGQICLPVVGALLTNIRNPKLYAGLYRAPTILSYTSRGIGTVAIPYRINCRPEVSIFTLVEA